MEGKLVWLMKVIVGAVVVLFYLGLFNATYVTIWRDPPDPKAVPQMVTYFVTAVNAVMATNLGIILGFTATNRSAFIQREPIEKIQWFAAFSYIISILLTIIMWGYAMHKYDYDEKRIAELLSQMSKNGLGILISVFAATLGIQVARNRSKQIAG